MARVICKLPNASELISGVKFLSHKLGVISEEIADEVAVEFLKIEGYVLAKSTAASKADATTTQPDAPVEADAATKTGDA